MRITTFVDPPAVAPGQPVSVSVVVRVEAPEPPGGAEQEAPPVSLALALDVSGSMAGPKLRQAQAAARGVIEHLRPVDRVALITFRERVRVVCPSQPVDAPDLLAARLESLVAGGSTNLSGGWSEAALEVRRHWRAGALNRVLLLTDGLANVGVIDPGRLTAMVAAARDDREGAVTTSCVGLGDAYDEDLLARLALHGGGIYHYAPDADGLDASFQQELGHLRAVSAQNLVLTLRPGPQVQSVRQLGEHPHEVCPQTRSVSVRLGDLSAGSHLLLGLVCHLAPASGAEVAPLLSGELRYHDVSTAAPTFAERPLRAAVALDGPRAATDLQGRRDLWVLRLARARRKAARAADRGDVARARWLISGAQGAARREAPTEDPAVAVHLEGLESFDRLLRDRPTAWGQGTACRKATLYASYSASCMIKSS